MGEAREVTATTAAGASSAPIVGARTTLRTLVALAVVGVAFVGGGLATWALAALLRGAQQTDQTVVRATTPVVAAIRDLARLEAASYHMERVIDLRDRQSHLFGLFESEDALLLVAAADVVAGVDLTSMRDGDIRYDEARRWAEITLPPPIILSARLDNERTYVHARNTGSLAMRAESLETRARQEAERTLRDAALEAGILARARTNAARTVRTLVQSLGYAQVEVTFQSE